MSEVILLGAGALLDFSVSVSLDGQPLTAVPDDCQPTALDRANGDVHPEGNPHLQMDPHCMLTIAKALDARLPQTKRTWIKFRGGAYSGANLFAFGSAPRP